MFKTRYTGSSITQKHLSNTSPERRITIWSFCVNLTELDFKPQKHKGDFFEKHLITLGKKRERWKIMKWVSFHETRLKTGFFLLSQTVHVALVLVIDTGITDVPNHF